MTRKRAFDYSAVFQISCLFLESKELSATLKGLFLLLCENIYLPALTSVVTSTVAKPSLRRSGP
uniref:Uncharacterized protein n=1 Tax=Daphnia galeata TaxID=27404 RepID=A0A8J2RDL4_9CRUS|nr:unnamed protein product [Daphnia galeata]